MTCDSSKETLLRQKCPKDCDADRKPLGQLTVPLSNRHVRFDAGGCRNIGEVAAETETVDGVSDSLAALSI